MDADQFKRYIIDPTLKEIGHYSREASALLHAIAAHESQGFRYVRQVPDGPALGFYQMEPATHADLYENFLDFPKNEALLMKIERLCPAPFGAHYVDINRHTPKENVQRAWAFYETQLIRNPSYATACARAQILRAPCRLPAADDIRGQAEYWKRYWNTERGKGMEAAFIESWRVHIIQGE